MLLPTLAGGAPMQPARNPAGSHGNPASGPLANEPAWPAGMKELVNLKGRIGGMFANDGDFFLYAGTAHEFSAFLAGYAEIPGLEKHRLVLHPGAGEAGLLAGGKRWPCDWKLRWHPGASRSGPAVSGPVRLAGHLLEVHFWTEGRLALADVVIPENVEVSHPNVSIN